MRWPRAALRCALHVASCVSSLSSCHRNGKQLHLFDPRRKRGRPMTMTMPRGDKPRLSGAKAQAPLGAVCSPVVIVMMLLPA